MAFSLFGNRQKKIPESKQVQEIELDKIIPNRYQPRHTFSDESIEELAATLKEQGLLQPIILRKPADGPEGEYEILSLIHISEPTRRRGISVAGVGV